MKKILGIGLTILLMACGGGGDQQSAKEVGGISLDSIVADTVVKLLDETDAPTLHLHLSMVYGKDKEATTLNRSIIHGGFLTPDYMGLLSEQATMRHAVDSFLTGYAKDYQRDYAPLYRGDRQHKNSYQLDYNVRTTARQYRDGIVCYLMQSTYYGGGEHEVTATVVKNIRLKDGSTVMLKDLLAEGYEQPLTDLLVEKLCDEQGVKTLKALQEKGFFVGIDPYVTDNFILGSDGLTFIYVDSEIAPHETGEVRLTLTDDELKDLIK